MSRKLTTESFIEKAFMVHGDKYDYSKVNYVDFKTKIEIICPIHGSFWPTPARFLAGSNCQKCSNKNNADVTILTQKQWLEKAREIHGDKYNYFLLDYKNSRSKVKIICSIHGVFEQHANSHLQGCGCKKCAPQHQFLTQEQWIKTANKVHYKKYDYSKVKYINSRSKVIIICPEHGEFKQAAESHTSGIGCPFCISSKGEILIRKWLENNNISFVEQYRFEDCRYKNTMPFDFYLSSKNICIEYDGEHHYKTIKHFKNSLELIQLKDSIKTQYCLDNKIELIRIPYWDIDNIESILDKRFK